MLFKNKKRLVLITAVVFAFVSLIGYRIYGNIADNKARAAKMAQNGVASVQVSIVGRKDITPRMVFSANLEPVWSADISAKVDGRINLLNVNEGDLVAAGAVIAVLDTNDLEAQVIQAQGNLAAVQSNLEQAELEYRRYGALAEQGAVSAQMLDNARTKRDANAGQVKAAQGSLNLMQEKLNNANVITPRGGVVAKRFYQEGTFVRSGTAIVTVADTDKLLAKATVGEAQVGSLSVGGNVIINVDALAGQAFEGAVTRVSPVASLPARTFTAEVTIDNSNGLLKAGMFAKAEIALQQHNAVVAIPESALVMREDQKTVFVAGVNNKVEQRILTLGFSQDGWVEVLSGLEEGERIVTTGQNKLRDGVDIVAVESGEQ